jgi:hypothetical protein
MESARGATHVTTWKEVVDRLEGKDTTEFECVVGGREE